LEEAGQGYARCCVGLKDGCEVTEERASNTPKAVGLEDVIGLALTSQKIEFADEIAGTLTPLEQKGWKTR
jgi:hypothetical protein